MTVLTCAVEENQPWLPDTTGITVHQVPGSFVQRDTNMVQRTIARLHHRLMGRPGHGLLRFMADMVLPEAHALRWDLMPGEAAALVGRHDVVLATCPSWYHFRLAARLAALWKSMFLGDYRDPWTLHTNHVDMGVLSSHGSGIVGLLRRWRMETLERKWAGRAFALTGATGPFLENAKAATGVTRGLVVHGGFDPNIKPGGFVAGERFTLLYTGRLYDGQDWSIVINAITSMHARDPDLGRKFVLDILGGVSMDEGLLERLKELARITASVRFIERAPREATLRAQQRADALLNISLVGNRGWLPVKFLEYLGSGRPIIQVAREDDLTTAAVDRTATGIVVRTAAELEALLGKELDRRMRGEHWSIAPDPVELAHFDYSRQMARWTLAIREWHAAFKAEQ